jgi:hypothetical protein
MSTHQMDYFAQKPDLDLKPFFAGKGIKLADSVPTSGAGAPPPKDTYWVATPENTETE